MAKIGYARVSTDEQNLDLQMDALHAAGCDAIYQDEGISGASIQRNGLSQALSSLKEGDTLVVWKLDRLGRSLSFLCELIADFKTHNIGFQSLTDGIDTTTTGGRLVFHIMGALAEFERDLIRERTKAGMQAAKKRGKHIGRPPALSNAQIKQMNIMLHKQNKTQREVAEILGVSVNTINRAVKKQKPPRSDITPEEHHRIMKRLDEIILEEEISQREYEQAKIDFTSSN
jgi:DNA invertase Pin-like site-specific DNA recombinase